MKHHHRRTQFHILSFEGPDAYARAGGIASRISGLAESLASSGFETHLWFVGDPGLPGLERRGRLVLHRWCQWISRHHPSGVYDGEEGKQDDYAASLPPVLVDEVLRPHVAGGGNAVVLAEEWHTVHAVYHLDWLLRGAGLRERTRILWNANNVFGFDRIDWPRLKSAATVTTVSRYMKHLMWPLGVDALVIPNGLAPDAFLPADRGAVAELRRRFGDRVVMTKVARFDPDKRWLLAVDTVGELKRQGLRPLFIARGGVESHGREVFESAARRGLRVVEVGVDGSGPGALVAALRTIDGADIVDLKTSLDPDARRTLFRAADAVLANSGREPFGLVGLEAMAAGGVACTGCTGEDYVVPGRNALVLQTADPNEFLGLFDQLRSDPTREQELRREGRATARAFAWSEVIRTNLLPRVGLTAPHPGPARIDPPGGSRAPAQMCAA
jgi:glycosyltransferase involved in cell wall biosynthesis